MNSLCTAGRLIFFNASYAVNAHVLGYLDGISAPGSDHFTPGANKKPGYRFFNQEPGAAEKPFQFLFVTLGGISGILYGIQAIRMLEEEYHRILFLVQR
jgi:hypothetical protein